MPTTPPLTCPTCGGEIFFQATPEVGTIGPFHAETFGKACPPKGARR